MNIASKLFCRKYISTIIITFVLMCSITMGTIGSASMISARHQVQDIENSYTTIAYPSSYERDEEGEYVDYGAFGSLVLPDEENGSRVIESEESIARNVVMEDARSSLEAHTPGNTSLSAFELGMYNRAICNGLNNSFIVASGTCESITKDIYVNAQFIDENGEEVENPYYDQLQYSMDFKLDKMIYCSDGHKTLERVDGITFYGLEICNEDGSCLFEIGKKYVIFAMARSCLGGCYLRGGKYEFSDPFYLPVHYNGGGISENSFQLEKVVNEQGEHYYVLKEDSFPVCAEYEGDVEQFLESEEGKVWREKVIPYCEINYQSVSVIGTNNLESMYFFNSGMASVVEGREFKEKEYKEGQRVCMVSVSYAIKNGLSIGDIITMDLYKGMYGRDEEAIGDYGLVMVRYQEMLKQENRLGIEEDWEIVGIYSAPDFLDGVASFNANTILVPKKSVPGGEEYEDSDDPLLYSIVLKNGTEEKFAKAIKPYIIGEPFRYANQGYDTVKESVNTMMKNAKRLCLACSAGAVISLLLVLFLLWKRLAGVINQMRMLGCSKGRTFRQTMVALLPTIGVSGVLGGVITIGCCKKLLGMLIKTELLVQSSTIIICVVVEMVLVLVVLGIVVNLMLKHKLINRNVE